MQLVDALHESAAVSDALWQELAACFEPEQIIELLVLVGFYHTISFVTNTLRIDLEENAERFPEAQAAARASS